MPQFSVSKSVLINAPKEKVYDVVSKFDSWTKWSPWLIAEPDAEVTVTENGKEYKWKGKVTGSGEMKVIKEEGPDAAYYDLTFLTPYKSHAKVSFLLKEKDGGTEATWTLDSSLPWFMFWMKDAMIGYLGMDYDRGLAMLKDYVEDGEVHSKLAFEGESRLDGFKYIGIRTNSSMDDISTSMEKDLEEIYHYAAPKNILKGVALSIYHKWDVVKQRVEYTAAVPVSEIPEDVPSKMVTGEIPSTKVYKTKHTGPYHHLGNAWSTMNMFQRSKVFKYNKKLHPFEMYLNDPAETKPNELETEVVFAVK